MAAPYSKEEDKIIKTMHAKGYSHHDIGRVLKSRSPENIKDRGYALGLKWTAKPEIDMAEFKRLMGGK